MSYLYQACMIAFLGMEEKPKIVVIVGPTASGKSDLAVVLALQFNGEVISADSRQVYKGLDVGTGKIMKEEMQGVPHHLLDVAPPDTVFSVAEYQHMGEVAIADILARGKLPIVCGGTGFYIRALVDGVMLPDVPPNPELRVDLEGLNAQELFTRLEAIDPVFAEIIDRHNPRRLVRAIEIATALGAVPKLIKNEGYDPLYIGIDVPTEILKERIHKRLYARLDAGMIEEAQRLHSEGLTYERMEDLGLEYRYLARYLNGSLDKETMLVELEREILHYAKRQLTWFKSNKEIRWIPLGDVESAKQLVAAFLT